MPQLLIIDDENDFRNSLSQRLTLREYDNITLENGKDAVKTVRANQDIDVVILDLNMPEVNGEQVLREIKAFRPELQVIMLTGHGDGESAMRLGKLDAFKYMEKPCKLDQLIAAIDDARRQKVDKMAQHEIPHVEKGSAWKWLVGTHNSRPGIIILGIILFFTTILLPAPKLLTDILSEEKTGEMTDVSLGYSDYKKMEVGESISDYYSVKYKVGNKEIDDKGKITYLPLDITETELKAKVALGVMIIAVLFWASGALPIGITALIVAAGFYFFGVMKPNEIAQSYAKDSVIFIFGVLALSKAISKTGLDRRIGTLLLGSSGSITKFLFIFVPLLAVASAFLSAHALMAFIMPVLMIVYSVSIQNNNVKSDPALAVMLVLAATFASNSGGPGSPVAGGRNVIMISILSDYGQSISFLDWVVYGMPFVPVMGIILALYFYLVLYRKVKCKKLNAAQIVKQANEKIGPMTKKEYITAIILIILISLWVFGGESLGLGGPILFTLILLNMMRILTWKDVAKIQWEVVALYAAATAMGKGLASTGAALFLAQSFLGILPDFMQAGEGLAIAASLVTGLITNFMSDGATVSAIGPITIPMATISETHPWMVGLSTAFASSFAHMLIIGTPNNAIAYTMAKDPITGKQVIKLSDFLIHGTVVFLLSMVVLWLWTIMGYWRWIGF